MSRRLSTAERTYWDFKALPGADGYVEPEALAAWRHDAVMASVDDEAHHGGHDWLYLSYPDGSAIRVDNPEQERGAAHVCILA